MLTGTLGCRLRCGIWCRGRWPLHITHLTIDTFDHVIIHKELGDDTELGRLWAGWSLEFGGRPEKALSQGDGQIHGMGVT